MFSDNHKSAKEAALQKLMDLMDSHETEGLKGLKGKPVAEMSVTKVEPAEDDHGEAGPNDFAKTWAEMKSGPAQDDEPEEDEAELSPEEKQRITDLYHKHVAGK